MPVAPSGAKRSSQVITVAEHVASQSQATFDLDVVDAEPGVLRCDQHFAAGGVEHRSGRGGRRCLRWSLRLVRSLFLDRSPWVYACVVTPH